MSRNRRLKADLDQMQLVSKSECWQKITVSEIIEQYKHTDADRRPHKSRQKHHKK
jgi:hypothetical protein